MDERKNRPDPTHGYQNQTFEQNYAGTFVARRQTEHDKSLEQASDSAETEKEPDPMETLKKVWGFIKDPSHSGAVIAILTLVIALSNIGYDVVASRQLGAMKESNDINRENVESVQRALVSYSGSPLPIQRLTGNRVSKITLIFRWGNDGVTSAINCKSRVNWITIPDDLPDNFSFPDIGSFKPKQFYIPPKGVANAPADIDIDWLKKTNTGTYRRFTWGWITYDDIFHGTKSISQNSATNSSTSRVPSKT